MDSKKLFCGIIQTTAIFLIILSLCLLIVSLCKGPFVEKHVIYKTNVEQVECGCTACHAETIDSCRPADQFEYTEMVYNIDGIVYFLGMFVCVIFLFLILSPIKYEYHELMHEERDREWAEEYDNKLAEYNDKLIKLQEQIIDMNKN